MTMALSTYATESLDAKIAYCRALAEADMLPRQFRDKPANLLFAIEYADSLGISRMSALTGIHMVDGKPTASADLIGGLIRRAGHKLRVTVAPDDSWAKVSIFRSDDPDFETSITWTVDKARKAGLWGKKGPWQNYPGAMLRSRAITECARAACSDVLHGLVYTPEELGAVIDESGAVVYDANMNPRMQPPLDAEIEDAPRQQQRQQQAPAQQQRPQQAQQGGMAGLAADLGQQQEPQPATEEEDAAFDAFVTEVEAAQDRDTCAALFKKAKAALPQRYIVKGQALCTARVGDIAAEKAKAEQEQDTAEHAAAVETVQETLDAEVVEES